jgi:hypothetical protein
MDAIWHTSRPTWRRRAGPNATSLGRDTTTIYVGLCSLPVPESADGNTARVFMNKKIRINNARKRSKVVF